MKRTEKLELIEAHQVEWASTWIWLAMVVVFFSLKACAGYLVLAGMVVWALPIVFVLGNLMHLHMLAFHEAVHRTICPHRLLNELIGLFIGSLSFVSLSAFRALHHSHHAYVGTERDEELWPFVLPSVSRPWRVLAATGELCFGLFFTFALCTRIYLRSGSPIRKPAIRRRIAWEYLLMAVVWTTIISATWWFGAWKVLLFCYVIPAWIAGNLHSFRKYTEHMGLLGETILGCTRSIVPQGGLEKLLSAGFYNISFHGIHHQLAALPYLRLPEYSDRLTPTRSDEPQPYTSYLRAITEMLQSLPNPRIGIQWRSLEDVETPAGRDDSATIEKLEVAELEEVVAAN